MTEARQKAKVKSKKVWRIFRFKERYELRDDERKCRKSGLLFTRDFVSVASGDEATGYYQQLTMLDNGDGENYCLLFGIYRKLVNEAGKRSRAYRGYLLDSDNQPLSDPDIAKLLKINSKKISKYLKRLEAVKLLEHVTMPQYWDISKNEPPKEEKKREDKGEKKQKKAAKSGGGRKRAENSVDGRKRAESSNRKRKPFKKTTTETNIKKQPKHKESNENADRLGNTKCANKNRQRESIHNSRALEEKTNSKTNSLSTTAQTPATTPPTMPQASDAERSNVIQFAKASPRSVQDNRSGPKKIGDVIAKMRHRYDSNARKFAIDIYKAFGEPWPLGSPDANREIGCFASCYEKTAILLASVRNEIFLSLVKEAFRLQKVYRKKGGYRSAVKVWCKRIFPEKLLARQQKCKVM